MNTAHIYVCHAYSKNPAKNVAAIKRICEELVSEGDLPIAPQLYLPQFMNDATQRDLAMQMCLELLAKCDMMIVYGTELTEGMLQEVEFAHEHHIRMEFQHFDLWKWCVDQNIIE